MHCGSIRSYALIVVLAISPGGCQTVVDAMDNDAGTDDLVPIPDSFTQTDLANDDLANGAPSLIILHTNDLHDHLLGFGPNADYSPATLKDDATAGGFARLATRIQDERQAAGATPVLLLDAGDFSMGTLFSWLALEEAPVLSLMQAMGYDAITIGNHELDWTPQGLAGTLATAAQQGFAVPVVASNLVFSQQDDGDDELEQLAAAGVIRERVVRTLPNGLKVGIFGLMGKAATQDAPLAAPVTFDDPIAVAQEMVTTLRTQDQVDLVICLSHSGINADGQGEDADLAAQVPDIDVIISGHSHTALPTAVTIGKTLIVQAGEHGQYLGRLELVVQQEMVSLKAAALLPVDDSTLGDPAIQSLVDGYISRLDLLLQQLGMGFKQVVAALAFDLESARFGESPLGNLIADAYRAVIDTLQPEEPLLMAFEANGIIGDDLRAGNGGALWFSDVYRALPMGIGLDGQPGYPLVTFYLTGDEIKQGLELTANAQDVLQSDDFFLQVSGVTVTYEPGRPPFDRITAVTQEDGTSIDLTDSTTCHKVGANFYLASMLSMVEAATGGALVIVPKEKDCQTAVTDISTRIVDRDPVAPGLQELKQWQALLQYLSALPDVNGDSIADIPEAYAAPQGRIVAK